MSGLKNLGVYLRVLHDYSYQGHDGSQVSIKGGEECLLLKKSTTDWWFVLRNGDKKPIYVPANYMDEIHKTIIRVEDGATNGNDVGEKKKRPQTAPKPSRQAPTPQPRLAVAPKKKSPPPIPPAKPVVRKASEEEEVLQQLDSILASAFGDIETIEEEVNDVDNGSYKSDSLPRGERNAAGDSQRSSLRSDGGSSKNNSLQRGLQPPSGPSSRTGSLQRGVTPPPASEVVQPDEGLKATGETEDPTAAAKVEPVPDYDEDDEGNHSNSSPGTGRHHHNHAHHSPKETFDSGISDGSTDCLDKDMESVGDTTSNENSMERGAKRESQELPDYENCGNVQRLSAMDPGQPDPSGAGSSTVNQTRPKEPDEFEQHDYANISEIQAHIHRDLPPSEPPPDAQPVEVMGDWNRYKHEASGRLYFYNVVSKETTWIAPKRVTSEVEEGGGAAPGTGDSEDSPREQPAGTEQQPEEPVEIPEGWKEELQPDGSIAYLNEYSSTKWRRSQHTSGKTYFYEIDGERTAWELPQLMGVAGGGGVRRRPNSHIQEGLRLRVVGLGRQHNKYRASWAPGERSVGETTATSALQAKLKAVGIPLMPYLLKTSANGEAVSKEDVGEESRDKFDVDKNLTKLEGMDPSHFSNPRKFLRLASSPGQLESVYTDIATPSPALLERYRGHYPTTGGQDDDTKALMRKVYSESDTPPDQQKMSAPELNSLRNEPADRKYSLMPDMNQNKERQGPLKLTKVSGKKSKKDWRGAYVCIKDGSVFIYKDQKSSAAKQGKPETIIDLKGAIVEQGGKEVTSKKNVFQITTSDDSRYLLQCEDELSMKQWCAVLRENMDNPDQLPLSSSNPEIYREAPATSTLKPVDETPASTLTRGGKKSTSKGERSSTPTDDLEKSGKIRQLLFKWLYSRPSVDSLREKGIYKDAVFGNHLHRICDKDGCNIPIFVSKCINAIERRGLQADGVYRISGNMAQIQKLRLQVDSGFQYNLDSPEWEIHVLTGALKMFFRELKEPLIPFSFFDKFMNANQSPTSTKEKTFRDLIKFLPPSNRESMKVLFHHLQNVIEYSSQNRMQVQNIAIVFGPTLMWPEQESSNVAITMVQSGQVVEYVLNHCKKLF